jgi:hypothetical protein
MRPKPSPRAQLVQHLQLRLGVAEGDLRPPVRSLFMKPALPALHHEAHSVP